MLAAPPADAIVAAVAALLRDTLIPALDGETLFAARVAANALDLVERELRLGSAAAAREAASLATSPALAGADDAALCARIDADGACPALIEHLWRVTLDRVAIDQPGYSRFRQACAAGETRKD